MKNTQLTAVVVIIILVAAIGGFVMFSSKQTGKAPFPTAPGFNPPLKPPSMGPEVGGLPPLSCLPPKILCPQGYVCVNGWCQFTGQPPTQPQPPAPAPETPLAVSPTVGSTERSEVECGKTITTISCICFMERTITGQCDGDLNVENWHYPSKKDLPGRLFVNLAGSALPLSWGCGWSDSFVFIIKAEGDLCGKEKEAERKTVCAEASKTKKECEIRDADIPKIDALLGKCVEEMESRCKGSAFSKSAPETSYSGGIIKSR